LLPNHARQLEDFIVMIKMIVMNDFEAKIFFVWRCPLPPGVKSPGTFAEGLFDT
jgi:hypothetical protein